MNTSTKVLLYTSKTLSNGEHPIMLRIIKDRKPIYKSIGLSCSKTFWDFETNLPKKKHPLKLELDILISKKVNETNRAILNLENEGKYFSVDMVKNKLNKAFSKITVFQFFDTEINCLTKANRIGYANVFKDSKRALMKFRAGKDLTFADINVKFLNDFENWHAERGVATNSISVYLRPLRTLMNKAIAEGYCPAEIYPFKAYIISKLHTETFKRALTREQIRKLSEVKVKDDSKLFHSKNYFLFSYYVMGMNFSDMAFLKWSNIREERLHYERVKTGGNHNVKLLPPAVEILNYYKENYLQSQKDFVFPILNESHSTSQSVNNRIKKVLKQTNSDLKEIARLAKVDFHLTTYVARHSWATILKRSGISTSVISEGLGHTTEKTTQIYLDSFENETLDDANQVLL